MYSYPGIHPGKATCTPPKHVFQPWNMNMNPTSVNIPTWGPASCHEILHSWGTCILPVSLDRGTCILAGNTPQQANLHSTRKFTTEGEHEAYQGTYFSIGTCILPGNASKLGNLPPTRVYILAGDPALYRGIHPSRETCILPGLPGNRVHYTRGTCTLPG